MRKVILNYAAGAQYPEWQDRLCCSLKDQGYNGDTLFYKNEYPPDCPSHQNVPYAFKPYAFMEAKRQGYDLALWCDAVIQCIRPLDDLFQHIERNGTFMVHSWWTVGQWCTDAALQKHGLSRNEAMGINDNWACVMGLNLKNPVACEFLDKWYEASRDGVSFIGPWTNADKKASQDERCLGHRHDQCISAIIAHKMGIERQKWEPTRFFAYSFQHAHRTVCLLSTR